MEALKGEEDLFLVRWEDNQGEEAVGPLAVLWDLIESYKLDVFSVSISRITNDFLEYMKNTANTSISRWSEFALMASYLVHWKSKSLLPDPGFEEEEYESALPPELVEKLLEYKKFQMAATKLSERDALLSGVYTRNQVEVTLGDDEEWLDVNLADLIHAFHNILTKDEESEEIKIWKAQEKNYSIADKMEHLRTVLLQKNEIEFRELLEQNGQDRREMVVSFLALLESIKQKWVRAIQNKTFGNIRIIRTETPWN